MWLVSVSSGSSVTEWVLLSYWWLPPWCQSDTWRPSCLGAHPPGDIHVWDPPWPRVSGESVRTLVSPLSDGHWSEPGPHVLTSLGGWDEGPAGWVGGVADVPPSSVLLPESLLLPTLPPPTPYNWRGTWGIELLLVSVSLWFVYFLMLKFYLP